LALFLNLYLGHLLGDFVLQPGRLVVAKRDGTPGLVLHTIIVGLCTLAVLIGTIRAQWSAAVIVAGMHLVIERLTIVTYLKTRTRGLYTLLLDQTMHALSIGLVVWLLGSWTFDRRAITFGVAVSTRFLASAVGVLSASLFGSILAFETGNALTGGPDAKGQILGMDLGRIAGFVERAAALVAALTLHPAALLIPFLPRIVCALTRRGDDRKRLLVEAGAGIALCGLMFVGIEVVSATAGAGAASWTCGPTMPGAMRALGPAI
jgi:hypothetical protein